MTNDIDFSCPCCSGKPYHACCGPLHEGKMAPASALDLMRSRYSAYATNNVAYIIRTTHHRHPAILQNLNVWKEEILKFCMSTEFERLEVLESKESSDRATVIFIAHLKQGNEDATFTERSFFAKVSGEWFYVNGDIFAGENRSIEL